MKPAQLTHLVCSTVLSYPDENLPSKLPALHAATVALPDRFARPLNQIMSYLDSNPLRTVAAHYVETFDLRRKCCLYLSYYTHGDTRRRGEALLRFRELYRAAGLQVTDEELPDHLAVVLEFSAAGHTEEAIELLVAHRPGLDLLCGTLSRLNSPYAHAVAAVLASLPKSGTAADERAARRLASQGPPTEQVGI